MKLICSITMLCAVLFQVTLKPLAMLQWKINQDIITEKYCVNKQNPMMHCDGKCYLAKQFRKLEMEEQKERSKHPFPAQQLKQAETVFVCPQTCSLLIRKEPTDQNAVLFISSKNLIPQGFQTDCFHPPQA